MDLESSRMAMLKKTMSDTHFTRVLPCKMKTPDAIIQCFLEKHAIPKPLLTPPRPDLLEFYRLKWAYQETYLDIEREARNYVGKVSVFNNL